MNLHIHTVLFIVAPTFYGSFVFRSLFCCAVLFVLPSAGEERASRLTFIVFWMVCYCYCSLSFPDGAIGQSVVCDFGNSWSYSLAFCKSICYSHTDT